MSAFSFNGQASGLCKLSDVLTIHGSCNILTAVTMLKDLLGDMFNLM